MSNPKPLAVQLYSAREEIAGDFEGTLRQIAAMGYLGVEPYGGMPGALADQAALFRELELEVCCSHIAFPDDENEGAILELAEAFNVSRIAIAFIPPDEFASVDAVKATCARLNAAGEWARGKGLSLSYHNHWWEYKMLDGVSTLELMLDELSDDVSLEIDTYWVQAGGMDAADALRTAGARSPLIHLKDGSLDPEGDMTAVGGGKMDMPAVVEASQATTDWYIVELDRCAGDMLEAIAESYRFLTGAGLSRGKI